jgi:gliding motility-associated-like protein
MKIKLRSFRVLLLLLSILFYSYGTQAQLPSCDPDVPFFQVDLTGDPDGFWESPSHSRKDNCCGTVSPDQCTSYEVILDPNAAMINLEIVSGAVPPGALFYQIDCGAPIPVGDPICISGVGPHRVTFCKPGNNKNIYRISSIAKPTFPEDITTRVGCVAPFNIYGLEGITINSINASNGNTTVGAFNNLLDCIDCPNPTFTPGISTPDWIDYEICGGPLASICGFVPVCDTVRIYTLDQLSIGVSPDPAFFCAGGSGVVLTASPSGGDGAYSYSWTDGSGNVVSSSINYNATTEETFTIELSDGLNSASCPSSYFSIPVTVGQPPIVDAGSDITVCAEDPIVFLAGSITPTGSFGAHWTGGAGVFSDDNSILTTYVPTTTEINTGFVTLTLESTNAGGGCVDDNDVITISFIDTVKVNPIFSPIICSGGSTTVSANATGGSGVYTYLWSTGETTSSIDVSAGTYSVMVIDNEGCAKGATVTVNDPVPIFLSTSSTPTSSNSNCDGDATVGISGGVAPYTIEWNGNPLLNTSTITGLCDGIYNVSITDANGCVVTTSVIVNNPICSSLNASIINQNNVSCFGDKNGFAEVQATGGTPGYSYSWNASPVQTTALASNIGAGTYDVIVTDVNGCQVIESVTITQPQIITNTMTSFDATSIGGTDGSATANTQGGTPPFSYFWVPGAQTTQTATNLSAGTYYLTISDDLGCIEQDSVLINQPPCNNFITVVDDNYLSCNGADDGSASVLIAHGTPPYNVDWIDGAGTTFASGTATVSGLAPDSYTVEVEDQSNCITFTTFDITEPDPLSIGLDAVNISCNGSGDGTIDLTVSGGTFPYSYQWFRSATPFATTQDIVNLIPGTYSVTVTDANGCSVSGSIGITQSAALDISVNVTDISCANANDGSLEATASGGILPYSYLWSGPGGYSATTENITGLTSGLYEVQVIDGNGCSLSSSEQAFIDEPNVVSIDSVSVDCPVPGATVTNVDVVTINGGDLGPYSVSFDNGGTFQTPGDYSADLSIGSSYTLIAEDGNGCQSITPFVIDLNSSVVIDSVVFNPCVPSGATTIPVTVYPNGGSNTDYSVSLDGGSTFQTVGTYVFNLNVGQSYDIVVTDENDCASLPTSITIPSELLASAGLINEVSCIGGSDGAVDLTVSGGTTAYLYSWTGPASFTAITQDISGLVEGTYQVDVTDQNGCVVSESIVVTTFPDVTDPVISCPANINVVADAGVCTYTNTGTGWDVVATDNCTTITVGYALTGATTGTGTTLDGVVFNNGTTTVTWTVTDAAGNESLCSYDIVVEDDQDPIISSCGVTGSQTVLADAGVCTYTNTGTGWDVVATDNCTTITVGYALTGATTGTGTTLDGVVFNNGATTVTWTVTDAAGNESLCSYDIVVEDDQDPIISGCPSNVNTNNDTGICGAVVTWTAPTVNDNCGVTSFTSTHNSGDVFPVGTTIVTYTATDDAGNVATCSFSITISDNENPVINGCPSNIVVSNDAGICGAVVTWALPTASDNCEVDVFTSTNNSGDLFPIGTTTVTYTAIDVAGNSVTCSFDVIVQDNENPTILCQPNLSVDADLGDCEANASGVNLGTPVTGDNCGVTSVINNAPASYPVGTTIVTWTVTDIHGNTATCTQNVEVHDAQAPIISDCGVIGSQTVVADAGVCIHTNIGTGWDVVATDNCTTTTSAYELTGATIGNGSTLDGVAFNNGITTVIWTVTDAAGNMSTCSFDIIVIDEEAPTVVDCPTTITSGTDLSDCGAIVNWTVPTFTDNCGTVNVVSSHDSGDFFSVGTTTVTYTGTDASGNITQCTFDVIVNDTELPTISCNTNIVSCDSIINYTSPSADDNCGVASITMISGLVSGSDFPVGTTTITYEVEDIHGNTAQCSFDITVLPLPESDIIETDVSCNGLGDGELDVTVTNGAGPYTFLWSNGSTTEDLTGLVPGIYDVVITDDNGCTTSDTAVITEPDLLEVSNTSQDVLCNGGSDGLIDLTVTGGVAPYSYNWSNGAMDEDLTNLVAGTYDVTITDDNGCIVQSSVVVSEPDTIQVTFTTTPATCEAANGTITIDVVGGTAPYSYSWSNGATTMNLRDIEAGTYELILTDANGCTFTLQAEVESISNLDASVSSTDMTCFGRENGTATVIVNTGNGPYQYEWSNGDTTASVQGLGVGIYEVLLTDDFGCQVTLEVEISQPDQIDIDLNSPDLGGGFNVNPYGADNGSITADVFGGTAPYNYNWSTGETTQDLTGLAAGTYNLVLTDENGCPGNASIILTQPMKLEMPDGFSPNDDGDNDFFVVRGIDAYESNEIKIFNRWGNIVYQKNNYDNKWDGRSNTGDQLPDATYFVIVTVDTQDGEVVLKGYVDLRRKY